MSTTNQGNIVWDEEFSVQVEKIDNQHKKIIDKINELSSIINKMGNVVAEKDKEKVGLIVDFMMGYAKVHFDTEEEYFKEFKYPYTEEHIQEHKKYLEKTEEFKKKFHQGKKIHDEIDNYLRNWWVNHILIADHKYIEHFKKNGLK